MDKERGFVLWFTGLSCSGKTTVSEIVEKEIRVRHDTVEVLDGDIVRTNLSKRWWRSGAVVGRQL